MMDGCLYVMFPRYWCLILFFLSFFLKLVRCESDGLRNSHFRFFFSLAVSLSVTHFSRLVDIAAKVLGTDTHLSINLAYLFTFRTLPARSEGYLSNTSGYYRYMADVKMSPRHTEQPLDNQGQNTQISRSHDLHPCTHALTHEFDNRGKGAAPGTVCKCNAMRCDAMRFEGFMPRVSVNIIPARLSSD